MSKLVTSEIGFLVRDPIYETVKPYSIRYDSGSDIPSTNIKTEKCSVKIEIAQNINTGLELCGFCSVKLPSRMRYEDFDNVSKIKCIYAPEIVSALKDRLNARHVYIIDYSIRKRHNSWPISTGRRYAVPQPASLAHIDFAYDEAVKMLHQLYGVHASEILKHRWQVINVWRPLKGPVFDWPLAICDARTFDTEQDAVTRDVVYSDWTYENILVHFNPSQKWYYFPGLEPTDVIIFKGADSLRSSVSACPHAAFFNPSTVPDEPPRESIDCRAFVLYAPFDEFPSETGSVYGERN